MATQQVQDFSHPNRVEGAELVNRNPYDQQALGAATEEVRYRVDKDKTMPTPTWLTLDMFIDQPTRNQAWLHHKYLTGASWPTHVDYEEDAETGLPVSVTRTFASSLPSDTSGTARQHQTRRRVNELLWMNTVREIDSDILTTSYIEWHEVDFWFPPYLDASTPLILLTNGDTVAIMPNKRSDHQAKVSCKFTTTYHTSIPTLDTLYQFLPIDIHFQFTNGLSFTMNNVITDGATVNIPVSDPTTSTVTAQATWPASEPSTTQYLADIGTTKTINDDITRWKFNLFKRVKVEMVIPDFEVTLNGTITT